MKKCIWASQAEKAVTGKAWRAGDSKQLKVREGGPAWGEMSLGRNPGSEKPVLCFKHDMIKFTP